MIYMKKPQVIQTDVRRRCVECQQRSRLAVTMDSTPDRYVPNCPNCGAVLRPLTPSEERHLRDVIENASRTP